MLMRLYNRVTIPQLGWAALALLLINLAFTLVLWRTLRRANRALVLPFFARDRAASAAYDSGYR